MSSDKTRFTFNPVNNSYYDHMTGEVISKKDFEKNTLKYHELVKEHLKSQINFPKGVTDPPKGKDPFPTIQFDEEFTLNPANPMDKAIGKAIMDIASGTNAKVINKPKVKLDKVYLRNNLPSWDDIIVQILREIKDQLVWHSPIEAFNPWIRFEAGIQNYLREMKKYTGNKPVQEPNYRLVELGMDLDVSKIFSIPITFKFLKNWNSLRERTFIKKGELFVLRTPHNGILPLQLFEFPQNQGIKAKSDFVMLLDPYVPSETDLTEEVYHKHGVLVVKKFDISAAPKLLELRKNIFLNAPTATNTILLFSLMDAIILNEYKSGTLDVDAQCEKNLQRLDKLKNLASSTTYNEERKNAVEKCFLQYNLIMQKRITSGETKVG